MQWNLDAAMKIYRDDVLLISSYLLETFYLQSNLVNMLPCCQKFKAQSLIFVHKTKNLIFDMS